MKPRHVVDQSYLLRLWADHANASVRAILVPVDKQDVRHHFANLNELLAFLSVATNNSRPDELADESDTSMP